MFRRSSIVRIYISTVLLGIIFIVASVFFMFDKTEYKQTTGTITDIRSEYDTVDGSNRYYVLVDYRAGGKWFKNAEYGSYDSSMKVGDKVDVLYDPNDPSHIQAPGYKVVPYVTCAGGFAAAAFGIISLKKLKERERKLLETDGTVQDTEA